MSRLVRSSQQHVRQWMPSAALVLLAVLSCGAQAQTPAGVTPPLPDPWIADPSEKENPVRSGLQRLLELLPPAPEPVPQGRQERIPLAGSQTDGNVQLESGNGRISLIARESSLHHILQLIAQSQGLNIVYAEPVQASVTVALNNVSVDEALSSVLSVAGFTWVRRGTIIYVTPINGGLSVPAPIQGRMLRVFHLDYASAADVATTVTGLLSPAGKSFVLQASNADNRKTREVLVVEDLPTYLEQIEQYIAQIDQPPRQVLIEVHVLQVELSDDNRHGVNFEHLLNIRKNSVKISTFGLANAAAPQAFFINLDGDQLDGVLEQLQTTTDTKTLASPRILVVNGQTARIQVGQQLGFRVTTTTETSTLESVDFLNVGVVLQVTPTISQDGRVMMNVLPEVSSGQVNPETGLPEEETSEVQTNVLLDSGQGMIIGGLIQETDSNVQSKIPFLGNIRFLGVLFQQRRTEKVRNEIIFGLVPHVLPLEGENEIRNMVEWERVRTPILSGPCKTHPRPWEPRLRDALDPPGPLMRLPAGP